MCRRSDRACRPARGHERALCNNMAEECQSMGKQGCPGGCKATDARRVVSGAPGARGTRPPRAISTPPPTVGRARTVVANPRNRDSDGGGKLRNLFAAYLHPPPSADLVPYAHLSQYNVTVHAEPQRCICRAAVWAAASRAAASRAAASRARGRRRRGRRRRGVEGGGDKGSSGATRAAAICMRAAGRRGWQRRPTRPEGGGDKSSDVAKGYTCNPNQGRG